ncbi:caspase domain-containing protein [Russula earlei]|uniref:Caspase domain-containing protein n=1 Tax=Russula earlei TaxID=71964 RepID=A0ACC0UHD9_9AGAM|nr:caspase domain-containing protein [Russula earlei]
MGNFVAPYSTATFFPRRIPDASMTHVPKSSSLSSPSSSAARPSLTSSLVLHTRRLITHLRLFVGSRIRSSDDVEEGLSRDGNGVHAQPEDVATTEKNVGSALPFALSAGTRRSRALLIGITYRGELLNTHKDVDRYRDVLIATYGYRPEDITVLKDDPAFSDHLQPTRENVLRELRNLVADAAAGDRFTFLYSGHSNQQPSKDLNEEDFLDEYLITIDDDIIIDNELNDILVKPLPAGSSLFALLDTCHSDTLLDLPHYHCNSVYVPWRSKGRRRTNSLQSVTVRRNAVFSQDPPLQDTAPRPPLAISTILTRSTRGIRSVLPMFVSIPLSIDRGVAPAPMEVAGRHLRDHGLPSSPRVCASPQSRFPCNGWCVSDPNMDTPTEVSLAACSNNQRSWESYDASLTRIVCNFLEWNRHPSYEDLMTHVNFNLHATTRQLREWTRSEKLKLKKHAEAARDVEADLCQEAGDAESFEGEMDNFQTPLLSSLVPLNMQDVLQV